MKSKELIEALQKIDPDGELDVVVNNEPIYFAEKLPAYYDGSFQQLIQDHSGDPYWNIVGLKFITSGKKIRLHLVDYEDILYMNQDAEIDLSDLSDRSRGSWEKKIEELRKRIKKENKNDL